MATKASALKTKILCHLPVLLTVLSFALSLLGQHFHEFWRDEAHTILLVKHSHSLQMLRELQRDTFHPFGYYLIEWLAYSLGRLPFMQFLNAGFVALGCYSLASSKNISPKFRWLLPFSFFPLFQFGVFLRSYSMLYGLICAYYLLREHARYPAIRRALLILVSQVHLYGILFAFVVALVEERETSPSSKSSILSKVIFWTALTASFASLVPTSQTSIGQAGGLLTCFVLASQSIAPFLLTVPTYSDAQSLLIGIGGTLYIIIAYLTIRHGDTNNRLILLATSVPVFLQSALFYPGQRWHASFLWILLILTANYSGASRKSIVLARLISIVLFYQLGLGVVSFASDVRFPYSSGAEIARFLSSHPSTDLVIIGVEGNSTQISWSNDLALPVAAYLENWRMGNPRETTVDAPFSTYYNKPRELRSCKVAVEELSAYMKARELNSVAVSSDTRAALACLSDSGTFTVDAQINAERGFDFGEHLSAVILSSKAA